MFSINASKLYFLWLIVFWLTSTLSIEESHYYLPVLPPRIDNDCAFMAAPTFPVWIKHKNGSNTMVRKYIPQILHFAIRNHSHEKPLHHKGLRERNTNWDIRYYDNEAKDLFMEKHFANTSLLWAYKLLNPEIGCSRPEIWRLAVLYLFGGMYMDDDATVGRPLDEVVKFDDRFIAGQEDYARDDRCYVNDFPLSNVSFVRRFGIDKVNSNLFAGKFLHNWAIFSTPGHPIIRRTLYHIVDLIRAEYGRMSLIKMSPSDHRGKLLMCATTFPITFSAMEIVFENKYGADLGLRTWPYKEYESNLKAWDNDWLPDRWVKVMQKHKKPYLLNYGTLDHGTLVSLLDGEIVQAPGQHEMFLILNGTKHSFADWSAFVSLDYDISQIKLVAHEVLGILEVGAQVDAHNAVYLRSNVKALATSRRDEYTTLQRNIIRKGLFNLTQDTEASCETMASRKLLPSEHALPGQYANAARSDKTEIQLNSLDKEVLSAALFDKQTRSVQQATIPRHLRSGGAPVSAERLARRLASRPGAEGEQLIRGTIDSQSPESHVHLTKRLEASMIFDYEYPEPVGNRRYDNSKSFIDELFSSKDGLNVTVNPRSLKMDSYNQNADKELFRFQAWPPVFTNDCPSVVPVQREDKVKGMDRGLLIAHREIWDHFVRSREKNPERLKISEDDDVMLVFEDDVYPMVPNHRLNMLREINRMRSDVHWLGWCYHHEAPSRSPLCMHAYAITVVGARNLLANTETCGPLPLDRQVRLMCDGNSTWSMTEGDWEFRTTHAQYFREVMRINGIHVPEVIHYGGYGGIYAQAKFEPFPNVDPKLVNTTALVQATGGRSVYLWMHGKLHPFHDANMFTKLGYSFSDIYHVSAWKLSLLKPVAENVNESLCQEKRCKLGKEK